MGWPTTDDPKIKFVTIRLTESESADVDLHSSASGHNRSAYVREAVSEKITRDQRRAKRQKGKG